VQEQQRLTLATAQQVDTSTRKVQVLLDGLDGIRHQITSHVHAVVGAMAKVGQFSRSGDPLTARSSRFPHDSVAGSEGCCYYGSCGPPSAVEVTMRDTPLKSMDDEPAVEDVSLPYSRLIHTADPYEARMRTQQFLGCSHRMAVPDRENPFLARVNYRGLNGLGLMTSTYGAAVEIGCSPPISRVTVSFVTGGRMLIDDGGHTAVADPHQAAAFSFQEELVMRWAPGMRQLMLTIDKQLIERQLESWLHQPLRQPLRFHGRIDLTRGGEGIAASVRTMRRALTLCGKAGPPPVLAGEIEHNVLTTLLLSQRHNYTDAIFAPITLPAPRVVRSVVELIDAAPQQPFTVAGLAMHAGISERSLQEAFRRQLGTSPMSYLRRRRIQQAHDELLRLDPAAGVTITDVALRHGFTHTGRFAATYRRMFGESPSTTLRR
jgi:AraC-like DNA-binding protein